MISINHYCVLTVAEAKALLQFSSNDKTRGICAVHFDGVRNQAVSTNGHQLAVCRVVSGTLLFTATIARAYFADAIKRAPKKSLLVVTASHLGFVPEEYAHDDSRIVGLVPHGKPAAEYPQYQAIIEATAPKSDERARCAGFSAVYLADLALVAKACANGAKHYPAIEWEMGEGPLDPARWVCRSMSGGGEWFGILMPVRI
jgi:hypothetical protein